MDFHIILTDVAKLYTGKNLEQHLTTECVRSRNTTRVTNKWLPSDLEAINQPADVHIGVRCEIPTNRRCYARAVSVQVARQVETARSRS
jgi:hypothetical protein